MGKALPGEHYCEAHQGNHSHYAPHNCTVCTLREQLANAHEAIRRGVEANVALQRDADRYERLSWLVALGEWSCAHHEVIDRYGLTDTYMDDKAMMDEWLDRPEVISDSAGCKAALQALEKEGKA